MAANASALEQQLTRARRRLFVGTLLAALAWAWALALLLAVGWFVAWPFVASEASSAWLRWSVVGGLLAIATLTALVLAWRRSPSRVTVALTVDERFGLKERVTTSLMLAPEQIASPAGQALLADADARVAALRIGDRFPVRLPWRPAALLPIGVLALVLLALLWQPGAPLNTVQGQEEDNAPTPEAKAEMDKKLRNLAQRPPRKPTDPPPSKEIERIEAEIDKLVHAPRETKDDVHKRIKEATKIEETIRKQQKAEADRIDAFKEQIKQAERLRKKEPPPEGPAKDAVKAFNEADFKASQDALEKLSRRLAKDKEKKEEIDRLRKKLKKDKEQPTPEERKEAEDRLKKLEEEKKKQEEQQDRLRKKLKDKKADLTPEQRQEAEDELKRLQRDQEEKKEEEDKLRKKLKNKEDKLTPEQRKEAEDRLNKLDRENDQQLSKKDKEDLKKEIEDLKDKAERLSRDKEKEEKDLKEKQEKERQQKEEEIKKKEEKGELNKEEAAQEREQLQRENDQQKKDAEKQEQDRKSLKEAADALGEAQKSMDEGKDGEAAKKLAKAASKLGKMDRSAQQRQLQQQLQRMQQARRALARGLSNRGGIGSGRRPDGKDSETGEDEKRAGGEIGKGKLEVVGTGGPDGGFKGPRTPAEMKEDIQRAAQEAPAAIERQRLPSSSKKMTRDFYEALRGPEPKKK